MSVSRVILSENVPGTEPFLIKTFKNKLEKTKKFYPQKTLAFQEMEVSSFKIKKFLIFLEMELSGLIFFFYFRRELSKLKNEKSHSEKVFFYILGN